MSKNPEETKNKYLVVEIIGTAIALITAIATISQSMLGEGYFRDKFIKTPTPQTAPPAPEITETTSPSENILFFEDFQDNQHSFYSFERGNWTIQEDSDQPGNKVLQVVPTSDTEPAMAVLIPNR